MSRPSVLGRTTGSVVYHHGVDDVIAPTSSQTDRNSRYAALYWRDVILYVIASSWPRVLAITWSPRLRTTVRCSVTDWQCCSSQVWADAPVGLIVLLLNSDFDDLTTSLDRWQPWICWTLWHRLRLKRRDNRTIHFYCVDTTNYKCKKTVVL